jgi:hypothetical protein
MKKTSNLIMAISLLVAIFFCNNANAQSSDSKFRFGIGIDGLLPVGSFTNTVNFGLGITPRLQYNVDNKFALTFTSGFYHFFTKKIFLTEGLGAGSSMENDLDIVPVKAGLKYFVLPNIYVAGEAGAGFEVEDGGGPVDLILSPSLGYASKNWDIGIRYENFHGQNSSVGLLGIRIAYGFGL